MTTIALAGRRIDAENSEKIRFPRHNIAAVEGRISEYLKAQEATNLVCSAACGADLLALKTAASLGIATTIVLPFDHERFLATSVTDRPGDWHALYQECIERARDSGSLVVVEGAPEGDAGYALATERIIQEAEYTGQPVRVCIVWEGLTKKEDDHSHALAQAARDRGWPIDDIPTLPTCFVVMGFHTKKDPETGRVLDLDKSYRHIIKPAAEAAGFRCFRADELKGAGVIDVPMYNWLYRADLVVADLSTLNPNAFFELGVRYALRPRTTVLVAEDRFQNPFDTNHLQTLPYRHDGEVLDIEAVQAACPELTKAIQEAISATTHVDSPVYTYLPNLEPPSFGASERMAEEDASAKAAARVDAADTPAARQALEQPMADLIDVALKYREGNEFKAMAALLEGVRVVQGDRADEYVLQQLALATYKSQHPGPTEALLQARHILEPLHPWTSLDAETVGLWGAIHKRLASVEDRSADQRAADLNIAVEALHRAYLLLGDHYNGINTAFVYDLRASRSTGDDAIADRVVARRIRAEVLDITERLLAQPPVGETEKGKIESRYWIEATRAEAIAGMGDFAQGVQLVEDAGQVEGVEQWMIETAMDQLGALQELMN